MTRIGGIAVAMPQQGFAGDDVEIDAVDSVRRAREIFVDQPLAEPDGLENLGAAVALDGADPHFAGDFQDRLVGGLDVIFLGRSPASLPAGACRPCA